MNPRDSLYQRAIDVGNFCPKGVYGSIPEDDICNDCKYLRLTRTMRFVCDWEPSCGTCKHRNRHSFRCDIDSTIRCSNSLPCTLYIPLP